MNPSNLSINYLISEYHHEAIYAHFTTLPTRGPWPTPSPHGGAPPGALAGAWRAGLRAGRRAAARPPSALALFPRQSTGGHREA